MKNIKIFALLMAALAAFSIQASAQAGGESKGLTDQQKMIPFVLGMSLSVLAETHDDNYAGVVETFSNNIRYYSAELKPVTELDENTSAIDRRETVATAIKAMRRKSSASDRWQMLVGDYFGNVFLHLKKNQNGNEINTDDLKFDLEMIGNMASNPPADIPANIVKRFRDYSKLRNEKNLLSETNVKKLATEVVAILDSMSN